MNASNVEGLRNAVIDTSERGLLAASRWAAEMLAGLLPSLKTPSMKSSTPAKRNNNINNAFPIRRPKSPPPPPPEAHFITPTSPPTDLITLTQLKEGNKSLDSLPSFERAGLAEVASTRTTVLDAPVSDEEKDAYSLARCFFDSRDFARVVYTLRDYKSAQSRFLSLYSEYLTAEKQALNAFYKRDIAKKHNPGPLNNSCIRLLDAIGQTDDPFLLFLKGLLLHRVSRRAEALECLIRSVNLYPWNWSAWLQLSTCLEDFEEYQGVSKHFPSHVATRIFQIRFMNELHSPGDNDLNMVESLLRLYPGSLFLMTQKALIHYHRREVADFDTAERVYDEIRRRDPFRIDDIDVFSNILYVMEKRTKLSKLAHEFLALDKDRPEVCCLIGNHYSLRADHEKAIKYFRRAVQLDRSCLSAWTLMGHEYIEMKNSQAAIEAYRRAVEVNKKDFRGWYGLGQAYELLNMPNYALYYYQRGAALRPYDVRMWQAMGMCYQDLNKLRYILSAAAVLRDHPLTSYIRPREAISCFKRALLSPDARETTLNLKIAALHDSLQERAEAAAYHRRCVEQGGNEKRHIVEYVQSCMYVARYHYQYGGGDMKVAKEYFEKVNASTVELESAVAGDFLRKLRSSHPEIF